MVKLQEVFLVDSNSFMTPYRFYYAFDLVPLYWKRIRKHIKEKRIVVLDMVNNEIENGDDDLSDWMKELDDLKVVSHRTFETVSKYQEVLQYVAECGLYKPSAVDAWAYKSVADPWLIASASVNDYILITEENSCRTLSKKQPNKTAKIPDVAGAFGVRTDNIFAMMRKLNIRIE